jgi:adenylate cyclase
VALGSQLAERRRRTHAAVARAIEQAHADKLDEQAALLAHHCEEAGDRARAARWYRRAAENVGRSNPVEGVRHMQRVLTLTDDEADSEERSELRLEACRSLFMVGGWRIGLEAEEIERIYAEGREMASRAGSVDQVIGLITGYGTMRGFAGEPRLYRELELEAAALVDATTSPGVVGITYVGTAYSSLVLGRLEDALRHAEHITSVTEGDIQAGVSVAGFSAWACSYQLRAEPEALLGRSEPAALHIEQGLRLSREHDQRDPLIWTLQVATRLAFLRGDPGEPALRQALEALEVAEKSGSAFHFVHARRALACAHLLMGAWTDAAEALEAALAVARESRSGLEREADYMGMLAQALLGMGDVAGAKAQAERAIARAREQETRLFEAEAELTLSRALAASGELADARAALARARDLVEAAGARALEPMLEEQEARITALEGGDPAPGLARARELYTSIGASGHAERLARESRA